MTALIVGIGFTVMVKEVAVPVHVTPALVKTGVTVIVAVTGTMDVLVAVNDGIFPEPPAPKPIDVFELTQL